MITQEPTAADVRRPSSADVALAQVSLPLMLIAAWSRSPSVFPEWAWLTDALLVLAALASWRAAGLPRTPSPLLVSAALLILLSNAVAPDAGAAIASLAAWVRLLLAGLVGASLLATPHFVRRAAWFLAAAGAAMSVHAALQVFVTHPALAREDGLPTTVVLGLLDARGNSVFLLPAHLGAFLAVSLVAAASLALGWHADRDETSRAPRVLAMLLALMTIAGLFLTASMGGALLAGLGLASLALLGLRGRRQVAVLALGLVLSLAIVAPSRLRRQAEIAHEEPGSARAANWASAVRLIREMPVLGCGGGAFAVEHERVRSRAENDARHAHQGYLEAAAEHGVAMLPLLAALLAALGWSAWALVGVRRDMALRGLRADLSSPLLHAMAACVLGAALIDFGWSDPAWGLPAAVIVGACLAAGRESSGAGAAIHEGRGTRAGLAAVALLGLVLLIIGLPASAAASLQRQALRAGEEGRHRDALHLLRRALALAPFDAKIPGLSAAAHLALAAGESVGSSSRSEHVAAAVAHARQAVDASPRSATARLTLARTLVAAGRRLEALAQASRAAQLAPHRAEARELRDLLASQVDP